MSSLKYVKQYDKNFTAPVVERKHIVLLDGTWNDETGENADGLVTNIVRLNQIFKNDEAHQIVRYHRGVGNDNDNGWVGKKWKGATGKAIGAIVEKAYARLVQDWQHGDRIYIFGFSRGSAAARLLASKIAKEGIPTSIEITLEPKENKESKVVEQRITDIQIDASKSLPVDIEFLGVWDTVSALGLLNNIWRLVGIKEDDLFTNDSIAKNIQRAVHLVAIDETRNPFIPSLMNHKEGVTHEVWFPGVHTDVGGGYAEAEIAQVSLYYMLKKLKEWNKNRNLLDFIIDEDYYNEYAKESINRACFHFHGDAFGEDLRHIGVQRNGKFNANLKPKIHRLYYDIASLKNTFSVVEVMNKKEIEKKFINFQYMPFNIKVLDGKYEIVE